MVIGSLLRKSRNYKLKLNHLSFRGIGLIISKDFLALVRSFQILYMVGFLVVILSIATSYVHPAAGILFQTCIIVCISLQSTQNIGSIMNKQQAGFLLPFSKKQICIVCSILPIIYSSFYLFLLMMILPSSVFQYATSIMMIAIILLLTNLLSLRFYRQHALWKSLSMLLYFLTLSCLFYS